MSYELLLPKTLKFLSELADTDTLREEQWQRLDQALYFVAVEQSTRMMTGRNAHMKPRPPSFVRPGNDEKKNDARMALSRAVQSGTITKPERCYRCSRKTIAPHLEGHHEDYSKPLDVVWLCRRCHRHIHDHAPSVAAFSGP